MRMLPSIRISCRAQYSVRLSSLMNDVMNYLVTVVMLNDDTIRWITPCWMLVNVDVDAW
jgi:hypothetical protein